MTAIRLKYLKTADERRYARRQKLKQATFVVCGTILAWLAMLYLAPSAHAHARHHQRHHIAHAIPAGQIACDRFGCRADHLQVHMTISRRRVSAVDANGNGSTVIGARPSGCPYAYCGCGLRKYLGLADRRLDLAWNWARFFPHVSAKPGAAAVRHHHVMLLVAHVAGSVWTVRDYNGGRHLSYIHDRDVRGYVFVDPSGGRVAAAAEGL